MATNETVDKSEKIYLLDKRKELIWALSYQGYSQTAIGIIFRVDKSLINRIMCELPEGWSPKWVKIV